MPQLPKLNTANLNDHSQDQPLSASALASPLTSVNVNGRPSLVSHESAKSRERTKFKGVIDKFMGNFNGSSNFDLLVAIRYSLTDMIYRKISVWK